MTKDNTNPVLDRRQNSPARIPETYDDLYRNENGNLKPQYRAPETDEEIEAHIEAMDELREQHDET